jgi:hypothetical protein
MVPTLLAALALIAALTASFVVSIVAVRAFPRPLDDPEPVQPPTPDLAPTPQLVELMGKVAALEVTVAGLPSLWEEERKRAKRSYAAARAAESKLARQREEDEEDDDDEEGDDVLALHARGGGAGGLYPLSDGMEELTESDVRRSADEQLNRFGLGGM